MILYDFIKVLFQVFSYLSSVINLLFTIGKYANRPSRNIIVFSFINNFSICGSVGIDKEATLSIGCRIYCALIILKIEINYFLFHNILITKKKKNYRNRVVKINICNSSIGKNLLY